MAQSLLDSKIQEYFRSLQNLTRHYHRRNKKQTHRKKRKYLKKVLNKIGPTIEPCGTPDVIV